MASRPRVAIVTCAELPGLDEDNQLLAQPLQARGIDTLPAIWDDPGVEWHSFDLAVVRCPWDYAARRDAFVAWAERVPRLLNTAPALRWNTDKTYLRELQEHTVPIVPTQWLEPKRGHSHFSAPRSGDWVVKPVVSASAVDTSRYRLDDVHERNAAVAHAEALLAAGRAVMVQPYQARIDTQGERSLIFLAGEYSHTVRKDPVLAGAREREDLRLVPGGGAGLRSCVPTPDELAIAQRALAAVPASCGPLLYARVDLVSGEDGAPLLMELEIAEPELFLRMDAAAPDRLAQGIERALSRRA